MIQLKYYAILFCLLLNATFFGCKQEEVERPFIRLRTLAATNIDETGATFNASVSNLKEDVIDHGFVWLDESTRFIFSDPNQLDFTISLGANLQGGSFTARLSLGLKENQRYFVRAYIKTNEQIIYGDEAIFNSKGSLLPTIAGISPNTITPGDTMTIAGSNFFGTKESLKVLIGSEEVSIVAITESAIKCIVPVLSADLEYQIVVVSPFEEQSSPFKLPRVGRPELFRLIPNLITFGDTITLEGRFFSPVKALNQLFIGPNELSYELVSASNNKLRFILKNAPIFPNAKLKAIVGINESSELDFVFAPPVIEDFFPKEGTVGDVITIVGRNFNPSSFSNFVSFNNNPWEVLSATARELKVVVREQFLGLSLNVSDKIVVNIGESLQAISQASFNYSNKDWRIVRELPLISSQTIGYATPQNLYYFSGFESTWQNYQFNSQSWRELNYTPNTELDFSAQLVLNVGNQGFAVQRNQITGTFHFWIHQSDTDRWTKMPNLAAASNLGSASNVAAFSIGREVFLFLSGRNNTSWKFNIDNRTWSAIDNFVPLVNSTGTAFPLTATSLGQKGYLVASSSNSEERMLLEYDAINNKWTKVENYSLNNTNIRPNAAFAFNNKIYVLTFNERFVYEWDTSTKKSRFYRLHTPPTDIQIYDGQPFVTNNKVFFTVGKYLYEWFPR